MNMDNVIDLKHIGITLPIIALFFYFLRPLWRMFGLSNHIINIILVLFFLGIMLGLYLNLTKNIDKPILTRDDQVLLAGIYFVRFVLLFFGVYLLNLLSLMKYKTFEYSSFVLIIIGFYFGIKGFYTYFSPFKVETSNSIN